MPVVLAYDARGPSPRCEALLDDGNRILISADRDGIRIEHLPGGGADPVLLFHASPDLAARICLGVARRDGETQPEPFEVIVHLVLGLGGPTLIRKAFAAAREAVEP